MYCFLLSCFVYQVLVHLVCMFWLVRSFTSSRKIKLYYLVYIFMVCFSPCKYLPSFYVVSVVSLLPQGIWKLSKRKGLGLKTRLRDWRKIIWKSVCKISLPRFISEKYRRVENLLIHQMDTDDVPWSIKTPFRQALFGEMAISKEKLQENMSSSVLSFIMKLPLF